MGVLILGDARLGGRDADVGSEEEFATHVLGVAAHDRDERLAQEGPSLQWINAVGIRRARRTRPQRCGECIDIDAARKVLAVSEQHRRAKVVVGILRGVGTGQGAERLGIDPVVNIGPVEADQADTTASLDRDLSSVRPRTRAVDT
ncbi:hypothetical protein [Methylobacterium brachiatum]|uniref:hypothetical protein n=1 Tax=Methylobacterium brachiatum TaxID=269660 RepID=UPI00111395A1|nr:hypothetical protein [Methylobacterium brachiatum]